MSQPAPQFAPVLLLAIDTCGPAGSVALGRATTGAVEILGQKELAGRTYSATLVAAIGELLADAQIRLEQLHAIVVVNGPGSFTGVRVGLSATKGLAEGASLPVLAVSRLEVLAFKARIPCAALDAHRGEIFLRIAGPKTGPKTGLKTAPTTDPETGPEMGPEMSMDTVIIPESRELLAGALELAHLPPPPRIAAGDEAAAALLRSAWPGAEVVTVSPPSASDALQLCAPRAAAGEFADLAFLDGHYLRRSDAEIFGDPAARPRSA